MLCLERLAKVSAKKTSHGIWITRRVAFTQTQETRQTALSGGQRQRVGIARARYAKPTVFFLFC